GVVEIDLAEAGDPGALAGREMGHFLVVTNILIESDLGAGQQADRRVGVALRSEAAGDGAGKGGRHQRIADRGRPRHDVMEAIVAHNLDLLWLVTSARFFGTCGAWPINVALVGSVPLTVG